MTIHGVGPTSVEILLPGTIVELSEKYDFPRDAIWRIGQIVRVHLIAELMDESGEEVESEMSVTYDILLLNDALEDAGFDLQRGVSAETIAVL